MGKRIAVTGGIGSGKSTAVEWIKEMGYPVYSCDALYAEILYEKDYVAEVERLFPQVIVNGAIDRAKLSAVVFSDENARKSLNALAHPRVMQRLYAIMDESEASLVFAEVPLLFEEGYQDDFDGIIVVLRDITQRINAVRERDGATNQQVLDRIYAQFDYDNAESVQSLKNEKIQFVYNNTSVYELKKSIQEVIKNFERAV